MYYTCKAGCAAAASAIAVAVLLVWRHVSYLPHLPHSHPMKKSEAREANTRRSTTEHDGKSVCVCRVCARERSRDNVNSENFNQGGTHFLRCEGKRDAAPAVVV